MSKKDATIIQNLRMGIPAAALTVAPVLTQAAEKPMLQRQNNQNNIEMAADKVADEMKNVYRAENRFIYDEQTGLQHVLANDTLFIERETQRPKSYIKQQKQSLFADYARAEANNELFKQDTVTIDTNQKMSEPLANGSFDKETKTVAVNTFVFDNEFLDKYIRKTLIHNDKLFDYFIVEKGRNLDDVVAEMKVSMTEKLQKEFNSQKRLNSTRKHEERHQRNDRQGNNLAGISPRQYAQLIQTDEISANIAELLVQRQDYLKTGDINAIDEEYDFYRNAIKNKQIVPGSRVKELEEKEFDCIMNGSQRNWLDKFREEYHDQIIDLTERMMKNPLSTIQPNDKELERREQTALTFEINGRSVNLYKYRKEAPEPAAKTTEEIDQKYKERSHGIDYQQLKGLSGGKKALAQKIMAMRGLSQSQPKIQKKTAVQYSHHQDYNR